ncbi:hypothetical protein THOB06_160079 [Vibrio rotiferianus]|nr:hypothetical protein THOB06_160079 [Vibrio rotiferianus]
MIFFLFVESSHATNRMATIPIIEFIKWFRQKGDRKGVGFYSETKKLQVGYVNSVKNQTDYYLTINVTN